MTEALQRRWRSWVARSGGARVRRGRTRPNRASPDVAWWKYQGRVVDARREGARSRSPSPGGASDAPQQLDVLPRFVPLPDLGARRGRGRPPKRADQLFALRGVTACRRVRARAARLWSRPVGICPRTLCGSPISTTTVPPTPWSLPLLVVLRRELARGDWLRSSACDSRRREALVYGRPSRPKPAGGPRSSATPPHLL